MSEGMVMVLLPKEEWQRIQSMQSEILERLRKISSPRTGFQVNHITAKEFMDAVRIKRTKFDSPVQGNKIRIIKKERKIYVRVEEVKRYFERGNG